jgi:carbon monoxide dehydrogenase subunit G
LDKGGSTTLKWTTENAYAVSIASIGSVALDGSKKINNVNASRTYVLTATGRGGTVTCTKKITVRPLKPQPKPVCDISVYPGAVVKGGSAKLTWTSKNATSAHLNKGIGAVAVNGSKNVTDIKYETTYTLTVKGKGGTATCHTKVKVKDVPPPPPKPIQCYIDPEKWEITEGESVLLKWGSSSTGLVSGFIDNGIGEVSPNYGSTEVTPHQTTKYSYVVTGSQGQKAYCNTLIVVKPKVCEYSAEEGSYGTYTNTCY